MEKETEPRFTVFFVHSFSLGILRRDFLDWLWKFLGAKPLIDTIRMDEDGTLIIGQPPMCSELKIPIPEKKTMSGHIAIYVDGIDAAALVLKSDKVDFKRSTRDYNGLMHHELELEIDRTIVIRLIQAPEGFHQMYLQACLDRRRAPTLL